MDINSLLSPSDTPTSETPPPPPAQVSTPLNPTSSPNRQHRPARLKQRNSSALSQQVHITSSPLHSPKDQLLTPLSHRDASLAHSQYPLSSPGVTSAPITNGRLGSARSTPTPGDNGRGLTPIRRQGSTPRMDTLADLASLQPPQQGNHSNQHPQSLQSIPRSISATSSKDIVMSDRSPKLPRNFQSSQSISTEDAQTLSQLSQQLADKPLDYAAHLQYIRLLKQGLTSHVEGGRPANTYELFNELRQARQSMDATYTLGEELWLEWLSDERLVANSTDDRFKVMELYTKCVEEEPSSSKLWRSYGDFMYDLWSSANQIPGSQMWSEEDRLVGQEAFTWDSMMQVWNEGIAATQWHISGGQNVWDRCVEIVLQDQRERPSAAKLSNLENMFATRLMKPHITWDETFQLYSNFISTYYSREYEEIMANATKQASQAKKQYGMREPFEHQLQLAVQKSDNDAEWHAFKSYLDWELKHKGIFSFDLINGLYERATTKFFTDASLWEDYAEFLIDNPHQSVSVLSVVIRATRHCPWSGDLWSHRILTLEAEKKSFEDIEKVKHKATESGMLDQGGMEELLKVYISWCGFLRRKAFENRAATEDDIDIAEVGIRSALEHVKAIGQKKYGNEFQGDPMYRLERIHIKFFTQSGNTTAARDLWEGLIKQQQNSYDFWYRYYIWEMVMWSKFSTKDNAGLQLRTPYEATALLRRALKLIPTVDWPEQLVAMFLNHCEQHESVQELRAAIIESRRANIEIAKRREKEAADAAALHQQGQHTSNGDTTMEDVETNSKRKRKFHSAEGGQIAKKTKADHEAEPIPQSIENETSPQPTVLKRDRENTTVIVRKLPADTTEGQVRQFFRDTGTIVSINLVKESNSQTATVEFESQDEAQYAQLRQAKPFRDHEIEITLGTETTLWVTNYPADADEPYIRTLFEPFGEIVSARFPSLKYDSHRRFCYVQFLTRDQAHAATQLDGKVLDEKHKLIVKISNPTIKNQRGGPIYEGREVIIHNISFEASSKDLQELAEKYGAIESIRVPTNFKGKPRGLGFIVFEAKDAADLAVESLNGKPFMGRNLNVQVADPNYKGKESQKTVMSSATPEPPTSNGNRPFMNYKDRTLCLLNVPDTVNDARIRALTEKHGPLNKIVMMHEHQGSLIEFKNLSDQGKAALELDGFEISPGRFLRVGTLADIKGSGAEFKTDRIGRKPVEKSKTTSSASASLKLLSGRTPGRPLLPSRRGGLGFKGSKQTIGTTKASQKDGDSTNPPAAPSDGAKSNADFKAMFLGAKNMKEESKEDE